MTIRYIIIFFLLTISCDEAEDCKGVVNGTAFTDDCDQCVGGTTGLLENYLMDECEVCGGEGAVYECGCADIPDGECDCDGNILDCAEECGGEALLDNCDVCDLDPLNDCIQDCNDEWGGDAVLDICDVCDGPGDIYECGCADIPDGECDCDGNILDECDECGGDGIDEGTCDCDSNVLDECGVCAGEGAVYECGCVDIPDGECDCDGNILDCTGECGGEALLDNCDICDTDPSNDCIQDCNGEWGGDAVVDECGVCGGNGIVEPYCDCNGNVLDCGGECGGDAYIDECNQCMCGPNGNPDLSECDDDDECEQGCDGQWYSDSDEMPILDECGICNGLGAIYQCGCTDIPNGACDCDGNVLDECGVCGGNGPGEGYDCNGNCIVEVDCLGICGGGSELDDCGICNGDGYIVNCLGTDNCTNMDCSGNCGGTLMLDCAGVCGGLSIVDCNGDCGNLGGNEFATYDSCGVCSGGNSGHIADSDMDCAGQCFGNAVIDECGECAGNGIDQGECDCAGNVDLGCGCGETGPSGCDEACGSTLEFDECGVCGGDGSDDLGCGCFEAGPSGCDEACGSTLEFDKCGVCGGDGSDDLGCGCFEVGPSGCDSACGSTLEFDECGVCDGPGSIYECGCNDIPVGECDCNGNILDGCNLCGDNILSCEDLPVNTIYLNSDGTMWYSSNQTIYGFQFDIHDIEVTDAFGGDAGDSSFSFEFNNNNDFSRVLGFSLSGTSISPGCGQLLNLTYDGSHGGVSNIIFAGLNGALVDMDYYNCP